MPIKLQRDVEPTLNLTPMIDIVFLLIIFFMVGTKFVEMERQLQVTLPSVKQGDPSVPTPARRVVHLYQDQTLSMDGNEFTLEQLIAELQRVKQQHGSLGVLVRGDGRVSLQQVAAILDACREAGLHQMGIAVRQDFALQR